MEIVDVPEKRPRAAPEEGLPPAKSAALEPAVDIPAILLQDLPPEVLERILAWGSVRVVLAVESLSAALRQAAGSAGLWRALFLADFVAPRFEIDEGETLRWFQSAAELDNDARLMFFAYWPLEAADGWIRGAAEAGRIGWREAYEVSFLELSFGGQFVRRTSRVVHSRQPTIPPINFSFRVYLILRRFERGGVPEALRSVRRVLRAAPPTKPVSLSTLVEGCGTTHVVKAGGENLTLRHLVTETQVVSFLSHMPWPPSRLRFGAEIFGAEMVVAVLLETVVRFDIEGPLTVRPDSVIVLLEDAVQLPDAPPARGTYSLDKENVEPSIAIGRDGTSGHLDLGLSITSGWKVAYVKGVTTMLHPRRLMRWHPVLDTIRWGAKSAEFM